MYVCVHLLCLCLSFSFSLSVSVCVCSDEHTWGLANDNTECHYLGNINFIWQACSLVWLSPSRLPWPARKYRELPDSVSLALDLPSYTSTLSFSTWVLGIRFLDLQGKYFANWAIFPVLNLSYFKHNVYDDIMITVMCVMYFCLLLYGFGRMNRTVMCSTRLWLLDLI